MTRVYEKLEKVENTDEHREYYPEMITVDDSGYDSFHIFSKYIYSKHLSIFYKTSKLLDADTFCNLISSIHISHDINYIF